jgi:hypothetical protein
MAIPITQAELGFDTKTQTRIVGIKPNRFGGDADNFEIRQPLDHLGQEEVRWYLEDYARWEPFATNRAIQAKSRLDILERYLAESIGPGLLLLARVTAGDEAEEANPPRRVHLVILSSKDDQDLNSFQWELLERGRYLDPRVIITTVSRLVGDFPEIVTLSDPPFHQLVGHVNVLIVSARPWGDADVQYQGVSQHIWNMAASELGQRQIRIHFVRPGTWSKFTSILDSHPPGYFHLVHFDTHGIVNAKSGV